MPKKERKEPIELIIRRLDLRLSKVERDIKLTSNVLKFLLNIFTSFDQQTAQEIKDHIRTMELIQ